MEIIKRTGIVREIRRFRELQIEIDGLDKASNDVEMAEISYLNHRNEAYCFEL